MNIKPSTVYFLKNVVFDCLSCGAFVCCLLSSLYFSFSDGIVSDVVVNQTVLFANHFSTNTMYTKIFAKKSATDNAAEQIRFAKQYVHDLYTVCWFINDECFVVSYRDTFQYDWFGGSSLKKHRNVTHYGIDRNFVPFC